ncbi:hypothetical protein VTN00DRAFT_143 [Thermoascus crustaceus]|uniref:uncharacterized protein n=1 Tax=Thermoascus crustaceus TaxID=5088 RepID=UPI003743B936
MVATAFRRDLLSEYFVLPAVYPGPRSAGCPNAAFHVASSAGKRTGDRHTGNNLKLRAVVAQSVQLLPQRKTAQGTDVPASTIERLQGSTRISTSGIPVGVCAQEACMLLYRTATALLIDKPWPLFPSHVVQHSSTPLAAGGSCSMPAAFLA